MVLLFNVYLTSSPANASLNLERGTLASYSKVDVTKYSLASLAVAYKWKRAIIKVEFGDEYKSQAEDFEQYVRDLFKDVDLQFSTTRNVYQKDWIETYSQLNDEIVLYLGNHDHIFLDNSTEYLEQLVEEMRSGKYNNPTLSVSHWPENIRWAKSGYIELGEQAPRQFNKNYKINELHITYDTVCIDSLNIITKNVYKEWFLEGVWGDHIRLPRTEGIGEHTLVSIKRSLGQSLPLQTMITPYKELFRHFDGYMHQRIGNDVCPSLSIPEGFFSSNMKINYGCAYKEGAINLDPKAETYRAHDLTGADYKITLQDLPIVWKDKVAETCISSYINEEESVHYRLRGVLAMLYSDPRYDLYIDSEIEHKVLNQYLKTYKQYQLI